MRVDDASRAYFDARAEAFDALYEPPPGVRGGIHRLLYAPLLRRHAVTLQALEDCTSLLDVGCGSGRYSVALATRGARVTGIDVSDPMLRLARARAADAGVTERCDFRRLSLAEFTGGPFEAVVAIGVLDYVPDAGPFLSRLCELAESRVVVSFPRPLAWRSALRRLRALARGTPPGFHTHRPRAVRAALTRAGWTAVRCGGGLVVAAPDGT